jgi:hypothetical protein
MLKFNGAIYACLDPAIPYCMRTAVTIRKYPQSLVEFAAGTEPEDIFAAYPVSTTDYREDP